jgi:ribosome biogenesis protein Tsr3
MRIEKYGPHTPQRVAPTQKTGMSMSLAGEKSSPIMTPDTSGYKFSGGMALANAVTDIGNKMFEAERVEQLSEGRVNALSEYSDLMVRLKRDPKLMGLTTSELLDVYEKESKNIHESILSQVSNPKAKEELSNYVRETGVRGRIQAQDIGWNRQVDRGVAKLNEQSERLIDQVVSGSDPTMAMETYEANVAEMVAAGYISNTEAQKRMEEFNEQAGETYVRNLMEVNPVGAFTLLSDDTKLTYLDGEVRQKLYSQAKRLAADFQTDQMADQVESQLVMRFKGNFGQGIRWLEDPKNYSKVPRDVRKEVIGVLKGRMERQKKAYNEYTTAGTRGEKQRFYELMETGDYEGAHKLINRAKFINPEDREKYRDKITSKQWTTSKPVYAGLIEEVNDFSGNEEERDKLIDRIDEKRGAGLSNVDADKLIGKIPKEGETNRKFAQQYGKGKFTALFTKKDDLEMHLKWSEFKLDMDDAMDEAEAAKGSKLTEREQMAIIDSWLDEQREVETLFGFDFLWKDKKYIPWEKKQKTGTAEPGSKKVEQKPAENENDPAGLF